LRELNWYKVLFFLRAYSARKFAAPAYSPEAEKPCIIRNTKSRIGAKIPIL
jgi:hypothetical protein